RITLRVVDGQGASDTAEALVTVADTEAPTLVLGGVPSILWPPNHRRVEVRPAWEATDRCDPSPGVVLTEAADSEPPDAAGDDDGRTGVDVAGADPGTADTVVELRAERSRAGTGRAYRLVYAALDASGNSATAEAVTTVPLDLGYGPEPLQLHLQIDTASGAAGMGRRPGRVRLRRDRRGHRRARRSRRPRRPGSGARPGPRGDRHVLE